MGARGVPKIVEFYRVLVLETIEGGGYVVHIAEYRPAHIAGK